MEKLRIKNEEVRAVGNMNVNARGDLIDSENKPISSRSQRVNNQYKKQTNRIAKDIPISKAKTTPETKVDEDISGLDTSSKIVSEPKPEVEAEIKEMASKAEEVVIEEEKPVTGLAAAIAKAREVKQEPMKTPREEERSTKGVKKI